MGKKMTVLGLVGFILGLSLNHSHLAYADPFHGKLVNGTGGNPPDNFYIAPMKGADGSVKGYTRLTLGARKNQGVTKQNLPVFSDCKPQIQAKTLKRSRKKTKVNRSDSDSVSCVEYPLWDEVTPKPKGNYSYVRGEKLYLADQDGSVEVVTQDSQTFEDEIPRFEIWLSLSETEENIQSIRANYKRIPTTPNPSASPSREIRSGKSE
jgi:hypothetical protein